LYVCRFFFFFNVCAWVWVSVWVWVWACLILKSRFVAKFTVWNEYEANVWELLPGCSICGGGGGQWQHLPDSLWLGLSRSIFVCMYIWIYMHMQIWIRTYIIYGLYVFKNWIFINKFTYKHVYVHIPYKIDYILQRRPMIFY